MKFFWIPLIFFCAVCLAQTVPPAPDRCKEAAQGFLEDRPNPQIQSPLPPAPVDGSASALPHTAEPPLSHVPADGREPNPDLEKTTSPNSLIINSSAEDSTTSLDKISKLSPDEIKDLPDSLIAPLASQDASLPAFFGTLPFGKRIPDFMISRSARELHRSAKAMKAKLNPAQQNAWVLRLFEYGFINFPSQDQVPFIPPVIISEVLQYMPEHFIPYLKKIQIQALRPLDISLLSLDKMKAFTKKQIKYFSVEQITAFDTEWFRTLPALDILTVLQMRGLSLEQVNILLQHRREDLNPKQLIELEIQKIKKLTEQEISSLDPQEIAHWASWQLGALTLEAGLLFRPEQVLAFTAQQIPFLNSEWARILAPIQLPHLSRTQIRALRKETLSPFRIDHIQAFTEEQISFFTSSQLEILIDKILPVENPWGFFSLLTPSQLRNLSLEAAQKLHTLAQTTENSQVLNPEQKTALQDVLRPQPSSVESASPLESKKEDLPSAEQIPDLPSAWAESLKPFQIESLTTAHIHALSPAHVGILSPQQFAYFSGKKLKLFRSEQMPWLQLEVIKALSLKQIHALTGEQMAGFTTEQIKAFHPDQINVFSSDQTAGFQAEQWEALLDTQLASFSEEHIGFITPDVIKLLSAEWFARLKPDQFTALTSEQIGVLNEEQLVDSDTAPLLTSEQIKALPLDMIWILNPDQIGQLKKEQIARLSLEQIKGLTADQVKGLTATQITLFNTEGAEVLIVQHVSYLSDLQMGAFSPELLKELPAPAKQKLLDEMNQRAGAKGLQVLNSAQKAAIGLL